MKTELSGLEIHYLVNEMQVLCGSKVSKISQKKWDLYFMLFKRGEQKYILRITPSLLYLTSKKPKAEQANFCMFLRRRLQNSILTHIEQKSIERIVILTFHAPDKDFRCIIELFNKGNVILCENDFVVISPMKTYEWQDRKIIPKQQYPFPVSKIASLEDINATTVYSILQTSKKTLVKKLATDLSLGGLVAEEICELGKLQKQRTETTTEECEKIVAIIQELLHATTKACCTKDSVLPFPFATEKEPQTFFDTFNSALDFFIQQQEEKRKETTYSQRYEKEAARLNKIITLQQSNLENFEKEIKANTRKAELIYQNYSFVNDVLTAIQKAREKKISWEEIRKKLLEKGIEVIPERGKVVVVLGD